MKERYTRILFIITIVSIYAIAYSGCNQIPAENDGGDNKSFVQKGNVEVFAREGDVEFGTAVNARYFRSEDESGFLRSDDGCDGFAEKYQNTLKDTFTWGVTENCLKLRNLRSPELVHRNEFNFQPGENILKWFERNNMTLKGHCLVWGNSEWNHVPEWIKNLPSERAKEKALEEHVRTVVRHFKGRINVWDVVNEPVHAKEWENTLNCSTVDLCFNALKWAHDESPECELYINDFDLIVNDYDRRTFIKLIDKLQDLKAPITGIGVQAHFVHKLPPTDTIEFALNELAQLGLPIDITEFDIFPPNNPNRKCRIDGVRYSSWFEYQAKAYRDAFKCFTAHKSVKRVFMWGFTDKSHWQYGAGIFDDEINPKPAAIALKSFLHND